MMTSYRYWRRQSSRRSRVAAAEQAFKDDLTRLSPDDICIDCGANVGKYTKVLAQTGAKIHAFEPDPEAFRALSADLGNSPNVTLWNAAIGTCEALLPLYRSTRFVAASVTHTASSSLLNESYRVAKSSDIRVRQIDFGDFLDSLPKPPVLVKIDIEGGEVEVLEMLFETGRVGKIKAIYVETHEKQLPSLRARTFALMDRAKQLSDTRINFDWG
ncbi:MAG: FkbM family methyltransferase [Rhodomicrobium sp.]|nr:FkbM family methyltransferase [Rhodomicrobium sp.]